MEVAQVIITDVRTGLYLLLLLVAAAQALVAKLVLLPALSTHRHLIRVTRKKISALPGHFGALDGVNAYVTIALSSSIF
jgi:hypothetical protein